MRGEISVFLVFILLGITVAMLTSFGITYRFIGDEGNVQKTELQSNIYTMDHSLQAAKTYLETSLDYSVYQACYDNLKNGGFSFVLDEDGINGYAFLPNLDKEMYYKYLSDKTKDNFNIYTNKPFVFLSENSVVLPTYEITIEADDNIFTVDASAYEKLRISKLSESGERATLKSSGDLKREYTLPCFELYSKAKEIKPILESSLNTAMEEGKQKIENSEEKCSTNQECTEILNSHLEENLEVPEKEWDYTITTELFETSANILSRVEIDGEVTLSVSTEAIQKIKINETNPGDDHFYPVWNGEEISFEPLEIVYLIEASA